MHVRILYWTVSLLAFIVMGCVGNSNQEGDLKEKVSMDYAIAYNVLTDSQNDNYEVFTMNLDGSGKRNITNSSGVEWTYFSHQDRVYFISDKDTCRRCFFLYCTNYQGREIKKISNIRLADSWMSAHDSVLIVVPYRSIDSAFYIIGLSGDILVSLYTGLPYSADPLFVNDGRQIVFRGGLTKSKLIEGFNEALYIIGRDGKNRKQLTHYPPSDTTATKFDYLAGTPRLHPIEGFISYQSFQKGKYSLFAVSLDGSKQWKLTENSENEGWHDWSQDGKWLAIELFDADQTQFHIGLMNWKTRELNILTDTTYQYQQSPNFVLK
ncbi:MAG: hypothetical protein HKN76_15870 [Saprospiraceae bacterium]|nr:hypothetical protein [Saprospiraceae bacterium]